MRVYIGNEAVIMKQSYIFRRKQLCLQKLLPYWRVNSFALRTCLHDVDRANRVINLDCNIATLGSWRRSTPEYTSYVMAMILRSRRAFDFYHDANTEVQPSEAKDRADKSKFASVRNRACE